MIKISTICYSFVTLFEIMDDKGFMSEKNTLFVCFI